MVYIRRVGIPHEKMFAVLKGVFLMSLHDCLFLLTDKNVLQKIGADGHTASNAPDLF